MSLVLLARRFDTCDPVRVTTEGRRIAAVEPVEVPDAAALPFVAPGFFDVQVNGWGGIWFSRVDLTPEDVARVVEQFLPHGVTRLLPTLITNSFDSLRAGFEAVAAACERFPLVADMVAGCHLEGPYISAEDGPRGAHPKGHVRPADWEEFSKLQAASGDRIRLVTLAPEVPGAIAFIREAVAAGVVVSIGHTAAEPEQIAAAAEAGATLSTHLGNAAHGLIRRHPNYIWEQLADDRLAASVIADGFHLPASVVKTILRTKPPGRVILTCDASGYAGCPAGVYRGESGDVEVLNDGRIVIAGQRQLLAGSGVATDACVAGVMRLAGVPLAGAVRMATEYPQRLMGVEPVRLEAGSRADLVLFHVERGPRLAVTATVLAGGLRHGAVASRRVCG
ncbi:MAG TPA: amidohydrolase family protein [Planctomycetaceae bacterium]